MKNLKFLLIFLISYCGYSQTVDLTDYNKFLKEHVSSKGIVNYDKVLKHIDDLRKITSSFAKISPNAGWTPSEKKAYWINFYNANIIRILAENYPIKSINYIKDAFDLKLVDYVGTKIALDTIEHEILRKLGDPRVHFALYSTAVSSPMLKREAYMADTIEKELGMATSNFLNDPAKNKIDPEETRLSKIFDWYKDDFASANDMINFINIHLGGQKISIDKTKISYIDFDWKLYTK